LPSFQLPLYGSLSILSRIAYAISCNSPRALRLCARKEPAEDFYAENTTQDIEIAITFGELNDDEKGFFSAYIDNDYLTVVRVFSLAANRKSGTYHGMRFQNPDFSEIRGAGGKTEVRNKYNDLRSTEKYSALPSIRSAEQALEELSKCCMPKWKGCWRRSFEASRPRSMPSPDLAFPLPLKFASEAS
jgi:hypothetical protein